MASPIPRPSSRSARVAARCAVLALLALAAIGVARPARAVQDFDDQATGGRAWDFMIATIEEDIRRQGATLDAVDQVLPEMFSELDRGLAKADIRFDQLRLLEGLTGSAPWAYRTLLIQHADTRNYVELKKKPLLERKQQLAAVKSGYGVLRSVSDKGRPDSYSEERRAVLESIEDRYRDLKHRVDAVKARIDEKLARADALESEIGAAALALDEEYRGVLESALVARAPSLLDTASWLTFPLALRQWVGASLQFWIPVLTWIQWGDMLLRAAVLLALLLAAGAIIRPRLPVCWRDGTISRPGWIIFALGLSAFAAQVVSLFTANAMTTLASVAVIALGMLLLFRRFLLGGPGASVPPLARSPLLVSYAVYLAGDMLKAALVPEIVLQAVWPPLLAVAAWRLRSARGDAGAPLESIMASAGFLLFPVLAVAAFMGFAFQALLAAQVWFMLLLTILLWACARKALCASEPAPDAAAEPALVRVSRRPPPSLARSVVFPLVVVVGFALFVAWVLLYIFSARIAGVLLAMNVTTAGMTFNFNRLVLIAVSFFAARLLLHGLRVALRMAETGRLRESAALAHTIETVASYAVWTGFLLTGLALLGVSLSALTWIASGLSVGIGFGMKDIVNNFISGLILMFGGTIKKGDIIKKGQTFGEVVDVSIRNTCVKTEDNNVVIIPNSSFLTGEVSNWSYKDAAMRLTIPLSVAPGTKIKKLEKLLLAAAREHPKVLKDPAPAVYYRGFGQFGLDFELYAWISDFKHKYQTESELVRDIDQRLQDEKIMLSFRGIKMKYKPKGTEAQQLEAARQALKEKRAVRNRLMAKVRLAHLGNRFPIGPLRPPGEGGAGAA